MKCLADFLEVAEKSILIKFSNDFIGGIFCDGGFFFIFSSFIGLEYHFAVYEFLLWKKK